MKSHTPDRPASGPLPDAHVAADAVASDSATRCGYVTLLGAPNTGKSTLLNALVGEPLSIVTAKAQTTWTRITGIRTGEGSQMIFLDTPGVLTPREPIHRSFLAGAEEAAREADVLVLLVDPLHPLDLTERERLLQIASSTRAPRIGVVNKIDVARPDAIGSERAWLEEATDSSGIHLVSAQHGQGLEALVQAIDALLPSGPFLYPEDEIASAPVRFFVAEMVREAIFEAYHQEVPYASICRVEEFREDRDPVYIQVTIYVERASQKGILIGEGGGAIRALGTEARKRIEHFLGRPVYLDLWVKVQPNWRRKPEQLRRFGLPVPDDDERSRPPT